MSDAERPTTPDPAVPEEPTSGPDAAPRTRAEARVQRETAQMGRKKAEKAEMRRRKAELRRSPVPLTEDDIPLKTADGRYVTRRSLREMRREARQRIGPTYVLRELAVVITLALFLSFAIKTWLVQPFFIPSGSMENTLLVGDRVLVSKLTPKPFDVKRGDIVVFEDPDHWLRDPAEVRRSAAGSALHDALVFVGLAPDDADNHLIKRVIGLPGDHVTCCTALGQVSVNGVPIKETYVRAGDVPSIDPFDIRVPQGKLWVMGDHRSNSGDSRYHPVGGDGSEGSVPVSKVVGRAVAIAWPADRITWLGRPDDVFAKVPDPR